MTAFYARSAAFCLALLGFAASRCFAQLPAFPGAEGAGKYTTGGRGSTAAPTTAFEVTDHDGMPDAYEAAHGLNPVDPADRATIATNGYPNLENYLNSLVGSTVLATTKAVAQSALLQVFPNPALAVVHPLQAGLAGQLTLYSFDGRLVATVAAAPAAQLRL